MNLRYCLGMSVVSAMLIGVGGCGNGSENPSGSATPSGGATATPANATVTTPAPDNTAMTQPSGTGSNLPGLPSVNGTSVKGLSTADAAALRLIDEAKNAAAKGDNSKLKTLVGELKQMYESLSPTMKSQVDELATKAGPATQPG